MICKEKAIMMPRKIERIFVGQKVTDSNVM